MTPITVFLFSLFILLQRVTPELAEKEKVAFITKVPHHPSYNWYDSPEPPCSTHWKGVTCDPTNVTVFFLRLPAARLIGEIPPNTIGTLPSLRILSLHTNRLNGTIPPDFSSLTEVLGEGSVATSYKQVLEEKKMTVVVKRLKDVVVTKMEFELQMEVLGKMKNENVVPLKAYYYSTDEKWLVYDYMPAGSLSTHLHDDVNGWKKKGFPSWLLHSEETDH